MSGFKNGARFQSREIKEDVAQGFVDLCHDTVAGLDAPRHQRIGVLGNRCRNLAIGDGFAAIGKIEGRRVLMLFETRLEQRIQVAAANGSTHDQSPTKRHQSHYLNW